MTHADRAGVRVRFGPEDVATRAEHLGLGVELDVTFEPDHRLPLSHGRTAYRTTSRPYPGRMSAPARPAWHGSGPVRNRELLRRGSAGEGRARARLRGLRPLAGAFARRAPTRSVADRPAGRGHRSRTGR